MRGRPTPLFALAALACALAVPRDGGGQPTPDPSAPASATEVPRALDPKGKVAEAVRKLAEDAERWGGKVAVMVIDVGTGAAIAAHAEHVPANPASNAKLVT